MNLLLLSNSTNAGSTYLLHAQEPIKEFLGKKPLHCAFIPYAAVTFSYDDYELKVKTAFQKFGHSVESVHHYDNPQDLIQKSDAILVGGGNTWQLLDCIQKLGIKKSIQQAVQSGKPYIGWSAGSNIACPSIKTTNDMPVVVPQDVSGLGFVPFQINPHYLDKNPDGHKGETREQRIHEFIEINRNIFVIGLREGTMLQLKNKQLTLIGDKPARIFKCHETSVELNSNDNFSKYLD